MKFYERPNLISLLILGVVVLIAGGYGLVTYTQGPEMEHYDVDPDYDFPFNFERPARSVNLPKELKEISGIADWRSPEQVIGVQDEDGKIFVIDTKTGKVIESAKFDKDADYEGITRVGDTIFILEQDGDIRWMVYEQGREEYKAEKMETAFSYRNNTEGICYDERTNSLLIVPKDQELNPGEDDFRHGVYTYRLNTRRLEQQPSFYVDEYQLGEIVYGQNRPYKIKPSGVAVDPVTGDIYVIASVGNIMVVIDRESNIKHLEVLKEKTLTQPEGITFNKAGDLFISSEGRGGKAVIVTFRRQASKDKSK